jgi:hypothetical protein
MVRAPFLSLLAALPLSLVSIEARGASCDDIEFSAEVLANYPSAREACQEIVTRDGFQYMQVRGEVRTDTTRGSEAPLRIYVRGLNETIEARPPAEMTYRIVNVQRQGRPPRVDRSRLKRGDVITVLIPISQLEDDDTLDEVAFAHAEPNRIAVVTAVEVEAAPAPARSLPRTAGPWPTVGLLGLLCLAVGGALRAARLRA